jgi:hypothetical protein
VVVTELLTVADADIAAVRDFAGDGVPVYRADASGQVLDCVVT